MNWPEWFTNFVRSGGWATLSTEVECKVLGAIMIHANGDISCWPGIDKLMQLTGLSGRGVRKALARLEDAGVITRRRRFGGSTVTTLSNRHARASSTPHEQARPCLTNRHACASRTGTPVPTNHPEEPSRRTNQHAAGVESPSEEKSLSTRTLEILHAVGVRGTVANTLSNQCTPADVVFAVDAIRARNGVKNPGGAIVAYLKSSDRESNPRTIPARKLIDLLNGGWVRAVRGVEISGTRITYNDQGIYSDGRYIGSPSLETDDIDFTAPHEVAA